MFAEIVNEFVTRIVGSFMHWIETKIARVTRTPEPPPLSSAERSASAQAQVPAKPSIALAAHRTREDGHER